MPKGKGYSFRNPPASAVGGSKKKNMKKNMKSMKKGSSPKKMKY
jgi:hypothetical protein